MAYRNHSSFFGHDTHAKGVPIMAFFTKFIIFFSKCSFWATVSCVTFRRYRAGVLVGVNNVSNHIKVVRIINFWSDKGRLKNASWLLTNGAKSLFTRSVLRGQPVILNVS